MGKRRLVQEAAVAKLVDSICAHLWEPSPKRPLVLSLHGPPGVGKSYFHQLLAEAAYGFSNDTVSASIKKDYLMYFLISILSLSLHTCWHESVIMFYVYTMIHW